MLVVVVVVVVVVVLLGNPTGLSWPNNRDSEIFLQILPESVQRRSRSKGSSQKFAHRGQTKELSYGTLPPPSLLKRKCDRQWEKCMADGHAHYPRYSQQLLKQCRLSHAGTLPLDVQRPLRNEQGDNFDLEQSKKNTISTFLSFSARSEVSGRCR